MISRTGALRLVEQSRDHQGGSCICCGLNLVLVQNFSHWFNFYFLLLCIHYHNLEQRQVKLKPVQKNIKASINLNHNISMETLALTQTCWKNWETSMKLTPCNEVLSFPMRAAEKNITLFHQSSYPLMPSFSLCFLAQKDEQCLHCFELPTLQDLQ